MKKYLLSLLVLTLVIIGIRPLIAARPHFNKSFTSPSVVVENRDLKGFSKIEVSGAFQIRIIKSNTYGVKVEADDELMRNIITEVSGDKLVVKLLYKDKSSYTKTKVLNITVQTPSLTALTCSGAVEASSDDIFEADKFELKTSGASEVKLGINAKLLISKFSGASEVKLKGKVDTHALEMTGASELEALDLEASKYAIQSKGASDCKIFVKDELAVSGSGASSIKYKGSPSKVTKDTRGATDISQL